MTSSIRGLWPHFLLCALVAVLLGCTGYWMLFTSFMPYDDEGTVLWSVRRFCDGHSLYAEVFSQYGPMFYAWYRLWHTATGLVFTSESGRWLTLVYWLIASGGCGYVTWRLTRRWLPSIAGGILSFAALQVMIGEPFHPGGILAAIAAIGAAICLDALLRGANPTFAIAGAVVGTVMALMKINVGVFFLIAVGSWMALHSGGRKWGRVALVLTALGIVVVPLVLMKVHLHEVWARDFVLVFAASGLAMLVTLHRTGRPADFTPRDWLASLIAATLITASMVVFCVTSGTSVAGFWEGVVIAPLGHPGVNTVAIQWRPGAVALALLSLVTAFVQLAPAARRATVIAWLRLLGGLAVLVTLTGWGFVQPFHFVFQFAPALAWLMVTPLTATGEADPDARGRAWLAWCAIWGALQAYPTGGSQMGWGAFLFVPLLVAGCYEAMCFLLQQTRRPQLAMPVAGGLLLILAALADGLLANDALLAYLEWEPLGLPGAQSLRLSGAHVSEIRVITRNVATHGDMLFSLPGLFSFNIWTQKPTPTNDNVGVWRKILSEEQKAAIAARLDEDKASMIIAWRDMFSGSDPGLSNFQPACFVGNYKLWTHKGVTILPLQTARIERTASGHAFFVMAADPTQHRIAGVQIRDTDRHAVAWKDGITPENGWRITPVNLQGHATQETRNETAPFALPGYSLVQVEINPAMATLDKDRAEIVLTDTDGAVVESFRFDKLAGGSEFVPR